MLRGIMKIKLIKDIILLNLIKIVKERNIGLTLCKVAAEIRLSKDIDKDLYS